MSSPRPRPTGGHKPRRREVRFPLDPSYLAPRSLDVNDPSRLPRVMLKSPTRHPLVYRKRIAEAAPTAQHGDIVQLSAEAGFQAFALWNPRAELCARVLSWDEPPLTAAWWRDRLAAAVELRRPLLAGENAPDACRLIHAEGDGLPGLVVDRYADLLVLEAFSLGMYQRGAAIAEQLLELTGARHWIVRPGPHTMEQEGFAAEGFQSGRAAQKVAIHEHGLRYEVYPHDGQKTGFYCDQRDNRQRLQQFCAGKSVLDLCCSSGGFALQAAQAGAQQVIAIDLDEEAIRQARRNAQLNQLSIKFVQADAFAYLRDMQRNGRTFDVVVLDPPKLIRGRDEETLGRNKYFDLNRLAGGVVAENGLLLTCSCSGLLSMEDFTRTVRAALAERHPQLLLRSGAGVDHPVALECLEGEYLKCLWLRLRGAPTVEKAGG